MDLKALNKLGLATALAANAPVAYYSHQVGVKEGMKESSQVTVEISPDAVWVRDKPGVKSKYADELLKELKKGGHNVDYDIQFTVDGW